MKRILLIALLLSGLMPAVAQVKKEDLATICLCINNAMRV
jgi:hypothetical protein